MNFIALLLFSITQAAAAAPIWDSAFEFAVEGKPRAVFFDAGTSSLLVATDVKTGARVDRYSLEGKLQEKGTMDAAGDAGALRAYDTKLFWIVGGKLKASGPHNTKLEVTKNFQDATLTDITVLRGGKPLGVGAAGVITDEKVDATFQGITGVYQYLDDIYLLADGKRLARAGKAGSEAFCENCRWLERTSAGDWLTVNGNKLLRRSGKKPAEKFLELSSAAGRPAYVFQKDPADDFILVPLPEEGKVKAFRARKEMTPQTFRPGAGAL
ncbi:MAG: hypothetical protein EOP11_00230 [Proteobacteria bacterium]|nr:MAG: hypothetical protein EOP11_00230 [Pseudomonadota bacterium]